MNFEFQIENSVLIKYIGNNGHVSVPSGISKIGFGAFSNAEVTKVVIPAGVETIGVSAFNSCKLLEQVSIPESVHAIGNSAFCWCRKLKSVELPNHIKRLGSHTFMGCNKLETVTLPNELEIIDENAFDFCSSLTKIVIPKSVSSIAEGAFENCDLLRDISILSEDIKIEKDAFKKISPAAIIKAPHCEISQFDTASKPSVVIGYVSLLEEGCHLDSRVLTSLKKYLKSQRAKYFQIAASEPLLSKYLQLWGIMPSQKESNTATTIQSLVDLYPKRTTGKIIATDLLIIAAAFGSCDDVKNVILKYGEDNFSEEGIRSSIYFAGVIADIQKLSIFSRMWNNQIDTVFDALFYKLFNPDQYWIDYHFIGSEQALDFYHSQAHNDISWPVLKNITRTQRLEYAEELLKSGFVPSDKFLSFQYAYGNFDIYKQICRYGADIDIKLFDYLFDPNAVNPKHYFSYGFRFYQTLREMENQEEARRQLQHIIKKLEIKSAKPIITNNMIKNKIAEYLFSTEIREFTLDHYDMSYITKSALKKLLTNCQSSV